MDKASLFDYRVLRKPRIKHLYLRITDGQVTVTANTHISKETIEQFVSSRSQWIQKQLEKKETIPKLTDTGAVIYLLGESFDIQIVMDDACKKEYMEIEEKWCKFYVSSTPTHARLQKLRDSYYKKRCSQVITPLVMHYAQIIQLSPGKITYRHNKSRWGSCSSQNNLSLNTRLMMLPKTMITYVIIHELAHIRYKNHSQTFWNTVKRYCPDYKNQRYGIRAFERLL